MTSYHYTPTLEDHLRAQAQISSLRFHSTPTPHVESSASIVPRLAPTTPPRLSPPTTQTTRWGVDVDTYHAAAQYSDVDDIYLALQIRRLDHEGGLR